MGLDDANFASVANSIMHILGRKVGVLIAQRMCFWQDFGHANCHLWPRIHSATCGGC